MTPAEGLSTPPCWSLEPLPVWCPEGLQSLQLVAHRRHTGGSRDLPRSCLLQNGRGCGLLSPRLHEAVVTRF